MLEASTRRDRVEVGCLAWYKMLLMRTLVHITALSEERVMCSSLLNHLHPGVIVRMKVGEGDEQSHAEVRTGFGSDP